MLGNTQFDSGRNELGSHRITPCLQNNKLNMSIIILIFFSLECTTLGWSEVLYTNVFQTGLLDSSLDVMLPMGTFLLWDTTKIGDETK